MHGPLRRGGVGLAIAVMATSGSIDRVGATAAPEPPSTPAAPLLVDGVYTAPDGSFSVPFAAVPTVAVDCATTAVIAGADGDSTTAIVTPRGAFETDPAAGPVEVASAFLTASGTEVELLADTATTLGPYPAAYFIGRLELHDDAGSAVVYGVVVTRPDDVVVAFGTDLGGDDAEAARIFVESFTLHLGPALGPTTTTVATPVPPSGSAATASDTASASTTSSPTTETTAPATTIPANATVALDGTWWVEFPAGSTPGVTAASESGFAFTDYRATVGDDVMFVRVTTVPAALEWRTSWVPGFPAVTATADVMERDGAPWAAASRFDTDAGTVTAYVVRPTANELVTVAYVDGGARSANEASSFVSSFRLAD